MNPSETKILVVDDEPDIDEFLSYNLRKESSSIKSVNIGMDALRQLPRFSPHLVLLDLMMPEMDGIETCQKIR